MTAIATTALTKHYGDVRAVHGVDLDLAEDRIHGLLGRNGAGKTTLMQLLTGQVFATSGGVRLLGCDPVENPDVLARTCFIQEGQRYPDGFRPRDVLRIAADLYPRWDAAFAEQLVARFGLPVDRPIKKLSRGQLSMIGVVLGLASRAEITFLDEPYLGLDAVARTELYDAILADFAEHPRTFVISTHHIDEVANLLEHVVILDEGRVLLDADADELHGAALRISGRAADVEAFAGARPGAHVDRMGPFAAATVRASAGDDAAANAAGLEVSPVSLQDLFVHLTTAPATGAAERPVAAGRR